MRIVGLLLSLTIGVAGSGCKGKGDADAAPDPAALKAQQDLVTRRDLLMAERKKLEGEKDALEAEIKDVTSKGGDPTDLVKKRDVIATKIETQATDLSSVSNKLDQMVTTTGDISGREAQIAIREKQLASREAAFGEREAAFVKLTADSAKQWKETCNVGGPAMIVQVAPPKGGNYTRPEVDSVYGKAKGLMRSKGLLPSDLGPGASLDGEAQTAMAKQDWVGAYVAASQLLKYAEAIKIDRAFILAKHSRLNAAVRSSKRDEAVQKQLTDGLSDVMQKFGDGNHTAANAKLNQLWALVR